MKQRLWPIHCVQGTEGAELISELDIAKFNLFVKKGQSTNVEMYSAFTDSFGNLTHGQGGVSHDLAEELTSRDVSDVFVVGLAGEYCVKFTAIGAAKAGFNTFLIEEAQRGVDPSLWPDAKSELERSDVLVVSMNGNEVQRLLAT
jgi:nicotinamidase-related amidase